MEEHHRAAAAATARAPRAPLALARGPRLHGKGRGHGHPWGGGRRGQGATVTRGARLRRRRPRRRPTPAGLRPLVGRCSPEARGDVGLVIPSLSPRSRLYWHLHEYRA